MEQKLTLQEKLNDVWALYKCECGNEIKCRIGRVNKNIQKSCGCFRKRHGLDGHPLQNAWNGMKARCYNENNEKYHRYGGRGVIVCDEWLHDFKAFYDWCIANGWESGMQVDKDIKAAMLGREGLIYSPEWCSIVTGGDNANYRKESHFITMDGETKTIKQWATMYGISAGTFYSRIKNGWGIESAFKTKPRRVNKVRKITTSKINYDIAQEIRKLHLQGESNIYIAKISSFDLFEFSIS